MKSWKLRALLNTPRSGLITVAALVLASELLLMELIHELYIDSFQHSHMLLNVIDAIVLAAVLVWALYFLVFRRMKESEQRFQLLYDSARDAIITVNDQALISGWNLAAQQLFQYRAEEARGQPLHQLIAPLRYRDDAARGFAHFNQSGAGPIIGKTIEITALRKDGSEFPIELSVSSFTFKKRRHVMGVIRDITERKQAEKQAAEQLVEIERAWLEWESVFDSIDDPIFLHDSEFRVLRANRAYADKAGKSLEEIINQPYYTILPKHDGPLPSCLKGMKEEEEEELTVGAANYRSRAFSVRDKQGDFIYSVHLLEDITESKLAERALRDERDFAQSIITTAQTIVLTLDIEGRIVSFNPYLEALSGWRLEEARGKDWFSMFVPERDSKSIRKLFQTAIDGTRTLGNVTTLLSRDGRELHIEWYDTQLKDSKGEVKGLLAIGQDITQRELMEQEKLEAGTHLRNALEDAIGAIAATLEQRDPYTAGHQRRVAELARAIGVEMGLTDQILEGIYFGGLIHDIGKISVPAEILGKPGKISEIEFGLIKTHAEAGYQIVKDVEFPWPVAQMVYQHHERLDGSGYPQGLVGEQIILEARIMAVSDIVEAMSANRPYRPGLGMEAALKEITRLRGTGLDPLAVDACLRVISEQGFVFSK
ncbi:MAG: PAS domain S-box protein [Gallionella sp.]|nr:PAS domain S-box protein [Gallionella sp.]MDP1941752.1 PAS domain S-box protein [Gallionella sp.]